MDFSFALYLIIHLALAGIGAVVGLGIGVLASNVLVGVIAAATVTVILGVVADAPRLLHPLILVARGTLGATLYTALVLLLDGKLGG